MSISRFFQAMYGSQISYPISIALTKYSILCFYARIFKLVTWFRWTSIGIATITGAWLIASVGFDFVTVAEIEADRCRRSCQPFSSARRYIPSGTRPEQHIRALITSDTASVWRRPISAPI